MDIPQNIKDSINNNRKKVRILLLAMSTLTISKDDNTVEEYCYAYDAQKYYAYSQLIPGSKYIAYTLAKDKKKLDKIIVMNTAETLEKKQFIIDSEKYAISAYDFYKSQLSEWLSGKDKKHEDETVIPAVYENPNELFIGMNDDEKNSSPDVYLWRIAQTITAAGEGEDIELYIDTQGGDRNTIVQINAIVDLLRDRNVKVVKRIATEFNRENKKNNILNKIKEVNEQYKTYELLAAMNEFRQYGQAGGLKDFFDNANKFDRKLIEAINTAADAIQLSNVDGFDRAVDMIGKLKEEHETRDDIKTKFDIIYEDLINDYSSLLDADENEPDLRYVRQIEWCLKKGFIQQALTILEAKMPYEYVINGLKYYAKKGDSSIEFNERMEKVFYAIPNKDQYKLKDVDHYFIKDFEHMPEEYRQGFKVMSFTDTKADGDRVEHNIRKYKYLSYIRNQMAHATSMQHSKEGFCNYMKEKHPELKIFNDEKIPPKKEIIEDIREYLKEFKDLANKVSAEERASVLNLD